jgi:hypothetical protein
MIAAMVVGAAASAAIAQPRNPDKMPTSQCTTFIIDMSEVTSAGHAQLADEIRKVVNVLKPFQYFNVVVFGKGDVRKFQKAPIRATVDNKDELYAFMDEVEQADVAGDPDPLEILAEVAFAHKTIKPWKSFDSKTTKFGHQIYFVTAHDLPDQETVAKWLDEHDTGGAPIHTIAWMRHGEYEQRLREISERTKGKFKFLSLEEVNAMKPTTQPASTKPAANAPAAP